jgi:hypothetical protein
MKRRPAWRRACAVALAAWAGHAMADEHIPYQVQPGDTLYTVSQRLLESAEDWRLLARINRVQDPKRLVPGSVLMLPASRVMGAAQQAAVLYVKGEAVARAKGGATVPRALQAGDVLDEGTALQVADDGFVTLRLADGSVLHLQGGTRLTLQRLREAEQVQRRQSVIQLEQGRVDSTVQRQPRGSRFDVRTPLAVAGVRGTRFGVTVPAGGERMLSEVVEGQVAVTAGAAAPEAQVSAGQGAVVAAGTTAPQVRALLPAPALQGPQGPIERLPYELPIATAEDARGYRVQVAEDTEFLRVLIDQTAMGAAPRLTGLPDGEYVLRLRALDRDGLLGRELTQPIRVKTTPLPPLARAPLPQQVLGPGTVELRCTEVPGGTGYRLQWSRRADFTTPDGEQTQRDACRFVIELTEPGDYHWRVATLAPTAQGGEERGPYSDASRFTVVPVPPAPEPSVEFGDGPTVHWAGAAGERYQVQVASDLAFRELVRELEVDAPRVRLDLPAGCRVYYLRLRTVSPHGLVSQWSAARQVGVSGGVCSSDGSPIGLPHGGELGRHTP